MLENKRWYNRARALVPCLLEDAFILSEFQVSPGFLHHFPLNSELWISYKRILWIQNRTNCYFSTEVNQRFYTPPCKHCTDFTEKRIVSCHVSLFLFVLVVFLSIAEVHRNDTGLFYQDKRASVVLDSKWSGFFWTELNGITGTWMHAML